MSEKLTYKRLPSVFNDITINGQKVAIPHLFDAAKMQALFDSFHKPEDSNTRISNLILLADFLGLYADAVSLRHILNLIEINEENKGVNITKQLYDICKTFQSVILQKATSVMGGSMNSFFYLFMGL